MKPRLFVRSTTESKLTCPDFAQLCNTDILVLLQHKKITLLENNYYSIYKYTCGGIAVVRSKIPSQSRTMEIFYPAYAILC